MTKLTHYGIIGCGMMGQEHLKNIALLENTVIEAIYEPDAEMAKKASKFAPKAIFTNSVDELLDIKHSMLKNYFIKKSIFSWNTIIYINFMKKKDTYISRKFYFSLLNNNEKKNIISSLDSIINNNE